VNTKLYCTWIITTTEEGVRSLGHEVERGQTCEPVEQLKVSCEQGPVQRDKPHVGGHKGRKEGGRPCSAGKRMPEGNEGAAQSPLEVQDLQQSSQVRSSDGFHHTHPSPQ